MSKFFNFTLQEIERQRIIDEMLSDPYADSSTIGLESACETILKREVSERTILYDKDAMEDFIKEKFEGFNDENAIVEVKCHLEYKDHQSHLTPAFFNRNMKEEDVLCYKVIDECLCAKRWNEVYTKTDILERCNDILESSGLKRIAEKKLNKYIKNLNLLCEIKKIPQRWKYSKPEFSIKRFFPASNDYSNMQQLLQYLSRFSNLKNYEWVDEMSQHIEETFGLKSVSSDILQFEETLNEETIDFFPDILDAITNKKTIRIWYKPFSKSMEMEKVVFPYYLKQYERRWQLYGKEVGSNLEFCQYTLDRIFDVGFCDLPYESTEIDFEKELSSVVGFTIPNHKRDLKTIKLFVSKRKYPYIKTMPFHKSQKMIEKRDDGYVVTLKVIPNLELEKQLLLNMDGVTVMEPLSLKSKIIKYLNRGLSNYNGIKL